MKFSIIIPTYNRKDLLEKSLKKLESQIFRDFEVIVCDDGSNDGTRKMIEANDFNYPLRYIYITNSGGPAKPRNTAVKNASGEWICFLDADDLWDDKKLETCAKYTDTVDIIYHDMSIIDESNVVAGIFKGRKLSVAQPLYDILINFNPIATSSVCIDKKVFEEVGYFNESKELMFVEDLDYWLRAAYLKKIFLYINIDLGCYLSHSGNSSANYQKQLKKISLIYGNYENHFVGKKLKNIKSALNYIAGCLMEKDKEYQNAMRYFKKCLIFGSLNIRLKSFIKLIRFYATTFGK